MKTIVICGGNSGIGLEAARQLTALGHRVVLLGRDDRKGASALAELQPNPGTSAFLAVDLSTHAGVRSAAARVLAANEPVDVLLHTSGVLTFEDVRTTDGLHPFFAVNFLSRYHLTQLLVPTLRRSASPRVIMLTSDVPLDTTIDFDQFPMFSPFTFQPMTAPIQIGNHHYAAHLRDAEPHILAAVVNAGVADTGIWRATPQSFRPRVMNSIPQSASNPVALCLNDDWPSGSYWATLSQPEQATPLRLDPTATARVIATCHDLTGA